MNSVQNVMSHDHKRCDEIFTRAEQLVADNDWQQAEPVISAFNESLLAHFKHEENILFPAFEATTGMTGGPTKMMRHEHGQMRELLDEMLKAAEQQNQQRFLGLAETLFIFMQQHNMKEEQILYPMIDKECGDRAQELTQDVGNNIDSDAA